MVVSQFEKCVILAHAGISRHQLVQLPAFVGMTCNESPTKCLSSQCLLILKIQTEALPTDVHQATPVPGVLTQGEHTREKAA